jgi:hypothetical protein
MKARKGSFDITVQDQNGDPVKETVSGYRLNWIGVHKKTDYAYRPWSITHLPSGLSFGDAGRFHTRQDAIQVAERLDTFPGIEEEFTATRTVSDSFRDTLLAILNGDLSGPPETKEE